MARLILTLFVLLAQSLTHAYTPDAATRKAIAKTVSTELLAKTPRHARFSARMALAGNAPFKYYERIAKANGYEVHNDCTVATFVEVTTWQTAKSTELTPAEVRGIFQGCEASDGTTIGPKPLTQDVADRAIVRGVWQRSLALTGIRLRDNALVAAAQNDAQMQLRQLYGNPAALQLTDKGIVLVDDSTTAAIKQPAAAPAAKAAAVEVPATKTPPVTGPSKMVIRTMTRYGLGGVYIQNAAFLLLADGSILREPTIGPSHLDHTQSKRANAKNWGRWQQSGAQLVVSWPGKKTQTWKTWHQARPATNGFKLNGRFQSADSFGGGDVINFNTVAFTRDGRFALASVKGGNTPWLPAYAKAKSAGHYKINGHDMLLQFNNGQKQTLAFGLYPKDNEHFFMGSSHFAPLKK